MNRCIIHLKAHLSKDGISSASMCFFSNILRARIAALRDLGIEADIILFHPYDRWGYATMDAEN